MAKEDGMFLYIGTYPSEADARADYEIVKELHSLDAVGTYDAAVITKDDQGKVHVNKDESATRHGGWGGAAAGAVVGLLFPPSINLVIYSIATAGMSVTGPHGESVGSASVGARCNSCMPIRPAAGRLTTLRTRPAPRARCWPNDSAP